MKLYKNYFLMGVITRTASVIANLNCALFARISGVFVVKLGVFTGSKQTQSNNYEPKNKNVDKRTYSFS